MNSAVALWDRLTDILPGEGWEAGRVAVAALVFAVVLSIGVVAVGPVAVLNDGGATGDSPAGASPAEDESPESPSLTAMGDAAVTPSASLETTSDSIWVDEGTGATLALENVTDGISSYEVTLAVEDFASISPDNVSVPGDDDPSISRRDGQVVVRATPTAPRPVGTFEMTTRDGYLALSGDVPCRNRSAANQSACETRSAGQNASSQDVVDTRFEFGSENGSALEIQGLIYDDGTWQSTGVQFPNVSASRTVPGFCPASTQIECEEYEIPLHLQLSAIEPFRGTIDRDSGRMTIDEMALGLTPSYRFLQPGAPPYESVNETDAYWVTTSPHPPSRVEFTLNATTGKSGELRGEAPNLSAGNTSATFVANEFAVNDSFGSGEGTDFLGLPAPEPGTNWLDLDMAVEFGPFDPKNETVPAVELLSADVGGDRAGTANLSVVDLTVSDATGQPYGIDDRPSESIEVAEPVPPTVEIRDLELSASRVEQRETFHVSTTVENTGDLPATGAMTLQVGNRTLERTPSLSAGETAQVDFRDVDAGQFDAAAYSVHLATRNDSMSTPLTVIEPTPADGEAFLRLRPNATAADSGATTVEPGATRTYEIVVEGPDAGIPAYDFAIGIEDPSVAEIVDFETTAPDRGTYKMESIRDNGTSLRLQAALVDNTFDPAEEIVLGTFEVRATGNPGDSTTLGVDEGSTKLLQQDRPGLPFYDVPIVENSTLTISR